MGAAASSYYASRTPKGPDRDDDIFSLINNLFVERKEKIGIRQIKMLLLSRYNVVASKSKIARIKIKFNLVTKIRTKNKYRKFAKLKQEHETAPNILSRNFTTNVPDEIYSTDITELPYGGGKKAFLAVFKDLATKEIVGSEISRKIDLRLVSTALERALENLSEASRKLLMIHSDQGFHFTHFSYRKRLSENGITQSMSRRGNCLDNAPVESFFGYLKDHLELKTLQDFSEVEAEVTKQIDYYNNFRPQWDLKKMPPKQFRRHLESTTRLL